MQLTAQETTLLEMFRRLPPNLAHELMALVQRMAGLSPNTRIDWADSWSEEDLRGFTAHSLKRCARSKKHGPGRRLNWE